MKYVVLCILLVVQSMLYGQVIQEGSTYESYNNEVPVELIGDCGNNKYFLLGDLKEESVSAPYIDSMWVDIVDKKNLSLIAHKTISLSRIERKNFGDKKYYKAYHISKLFVYKNSIGVLAYKYDPSSFENVYYALMLDTLLSIKPLQYKELFRVKDSQMGKIEYKQHYLKDLDLDIDNLSATDVYFNQKLTANRLLNLSFSSYTLDFDSLILQNRNLSYNLTGFKYARLDRYLFLNKNRMVAIVSLSDTIYKKVFDNNIKVNDSQFFKTQYLIDIDFYKDSIRLIPLNINNSYFENVSIKLKANGDISIYSFYGDIEKVYGGFPSEYIKNKFVIPFLDLDREYIIFHRKGLFNATYNSNNSTLNKKDVIPFDEKTISQIMNPFENFMYHGIDIASVAHLHNRIVVVSNLRGGRKDNKINTVEHLYNLLFIENNRVLFVKNLPVSSGLDPLLLESAYTENDTNQLVHFLSFNQHDSKNLPNELYVPKEDQECLFYYTYNKIGEMNFKKLQQDSIDKYLWIVDINNNNNSNSSLGLETICFEESYDYANSKLSIRRYPNIQIKRITF